MHKLAGPILACALAALGGAPAVAADHGDGLSVATFNLHNLSPADGPRFDAIAGVVVTGLRAPDLLAVEEVQDSDGSVDSTVTDATVTLGNLVAALARAGAPDYASIDIAPIDDHDGGQPGGNIRCAFLYRKDRLRLAKRPTANPHLLSPDDPAFVASRKPLVAEFTFQGRALLAVAVHFVARTGDVDAGSATVPSPTQTRRLAQATVVAEFARGVLREQADAGVVVLGDFNGDLDEDPMRRIESAGLVDVARVLPPEGRWSYVYRGRPALLDHVLVGGWLQETFARAAIVHLDRTRTAVSDHDPVRADFQSSAFGAGFGCQLIGDAPRPGSTLPRIVAVLAGVTLAWRRWRRRP